MGVLGLWQILESVGHPIKLEGLEGKRLGVDANVWLYKFIRGFRDKDNATQIDGHKLGLFNRICKLLFYNIKPVFVFDGPAPVLKRRTLERRQNARSKHLMKVQGAAVRILAEQLKKQYPDAKLDGLMVHVPQFNSNRLVVAKKMTDEDASLFHLPTEVLSPSESDGEVEEIDLVTPERRKDAREIDVESKEFKSMPAEVRYEILQCQKEDIIRNSCTLPEDAGSFSNFQLERLKARRSIQEKIEQCEQDMCSLYTGESDGNQAAAVYSYRMQSDPTSRMIYMQKKEKSGGPQKIDFIVPDRGQEEQKIDIQSSMPAQAEPSNMQDPDKEQPVSRDRERTSLVSEAATSSHMANEMTARIVEEAMIEPHQQTMNDDLHNQEHALLKQRQRPIVHPRNLHQSSGTSTDPITVSKSPSPISSPLPVVASRQLGVSRASTGNHQASLHSSQTIRPPAIDDDTDSINSDPYDLRSSTIEIIDSHSNHSTTSDTDQWNGSSTMHPTLDSNHSSTGHNIDHQIDDPNQFRMPRKQSLEHIYDNACTTPEQSPEDKEQLVSRDREQASLVSQIVTSSRMANEVTARIVEEAKELLRLFGIPYVDAAGEAEAQCALLEELKLTEGTITDDSDIWLFGAKNVYRYFFSDDKYIMQYKMNDIEYHLRLTRQNLVCFAMLVGSDYTDGIMNVGPVNALEIISEFRGDGMEPLIKFKEWRDTQHEKSEVKVNRRKLLKFHLPEDFPSRVVFEGYMRPMADSSTEQFSWGIPELDELREYARRNFGWDSRKIDDKLLPVMKKLSERKTQPTIDMFFFKTAANQNPENFRSKRVNQALKKLAKHDVVVLSEDEGNQNESEAEDNNVTVNGEKSSQGRGKRGTNKNTTVQETKTKTTARKSKPKLRNASKPKRRRSNK